MPRLTAACTSATARWEMGNRYVYRLNNDAGVVNETNKVYVPVSRADLGQKLPQPRSTR
jgi:hypothetical protein